MSKVKIISIIYAIGIIIGALFFNVWGADTSPLKTLSVFAWTVIFIVALFFVDKLERTSSNFIRIVNFCFVYSLYS